jgi:hypothetical protein
VPVDSQPGLESQQLAAALAEAVLCHPMIAKGPAHPLVGWLPRWLLPALSDRKGDVIEREELIRLLLELAANEGAGAKNLTAPVRDLFRRILWTNGIVAPGRTLSDIRAAAQAEERDRPSDAAHVRQARAIIEAAQSDFVGKINNWFDQTMARVTQRYGSYARFVTIISAGLVAIVLQFDSLELLRRLSVDDAFRASLVEEAKTQEARAKELAKEAETTKPNETDGASGATGSTAATAAKETTDATSADLAAAKAKRDELNATLDKLRAPNLAILPDHFIWERVPQAQLIRNPFWTAPYPARYEVVTGGSAYQVVPRWQSDVLKDVKQAIDDADVPVLTEIVPEGDGVAIIAAEPIAAAICAGDKKDSCAASNLLRTWSDVARAQLPASLLADRDAATMVLAVDEKTASIPLTGPKAQRPKELQAAINASKLNVRATVADNDKRVDLTATTPAVHQIRLLAAADQPFSNLLVNPHRVPRAWVVPHANLETAIDKKTPKTLALVLAGTPHQILAGDWTSDGASDPQKLAAAINAAQQNVVASVHRGESLRLTAKRMGPIQLRYQPGRPDTNILDPEKRVSLRVLALLLQPAMLGVIVSWALLSLGAPFWYDTLKNLLKLRPTSAIAEEKQREDRSKDTAEKKG